MIVEILHLLRGEGAWCSEVREILDGNVVWRAYSRQRHDLFLPSHASEGAGVAGLLTGEAAVFALPSTESKEG